jgi:hypothetical protein
MPISTNDVSEVHKVRMQNSFWQFGVEGIIYPETFMLASGPYSSSGKYVASGEFYNDYPIYTGPNGRTYWKIYYRSKGTFAPHWVLNGNVHDNAHGTQAYFDHLFSPLI